jgi:hypothetical protein
MTYDTWKTTEPEPAYEEEEFYPRLSKEQIEEAIAVRNKEIEWNIRRLANLILNDEDRQQTEDLIMDLREERESLKRLLHVV